MAAMTMNYIISETNKQPNSNIDESETNTRAAGQSPELTVCGYTTSLMVISPAARTKAPTAATSARLNNKAQH
jgi:hypothetical protein